MRISKTQKLDYLGWLLSGLLFTVTIAEPIEAAEDLAAQKEALDVIADFADRLCKDIPLEGSGSKLDISGSAKAELSGLIKKLVDLGIQGAAKYEKSEYQGVPQEDLVKALKTSSDCKVNVFRELKDVLLGLEPEPGDRHYVVDDMKELEDAFKKANSPPEVRKNLRQSHILGKFIEDVVRFGVYGKTYEIHAHDADWRATPSEVYFDKHGRKLRNLKRSKRVGGLGNRWIEVKDSTFIWEKGAWINFK